MSLRNYLCLVVSVLLGNTTNALTIESTFDIGLEGWTVTGASSSWQNTDGHPGGYYRIGDRGDVATFAVAPSKFLGDLSAFSGGLLSVDLKGIAQPGTAVAPWYATIESGSNSARLDLIDAYPFPIAWTTVNLPLTSSAWAKSDTQWEQILSNVTEISLMLDSTSSSRDVVGMDNFRVTTKFSDSMTFKVLDSRSTYLKPTTAPDLAHLNEIGGPTVINLATDLPFSVAAGDWLRLNAVGDFKFTQAEPPLDDPGPYGDGMLREAFGVFSNSGTVLPLTAPIENVPIARVPGAIDIASTFANEVAGPPEQDIPEDFWIYSESSSVNGGNGILVQVPVGATHLILGAADTQWFDNSDPENDYGVQITKLYSGRLVGDWDFDGNVDGNDFLVWQRNLGSVGVDLPGDGNLDGDVDADDLAIWQENYGASVSSSLASTAAVPEPTATGLAAFAALSALGLRRK